MYSTVFESPA